jgi:SRSO17 transposase
LNKGVPTAPILADAGYGQETRFRQGITELGLSYVVGIQENTTVWRPGEIPQRKKRRKGKGRPPTRLQRDRDHQPVSVKQLALELPERAWKTVTWREGTRQTLRSRFAAVRVRPAHRDHLRTEPYPEEWLLIERPTKQQESTKYWLSTQPAQSRLSTLVRLAHHRWIIERDYQELKQELGLGHYEGRGWRGFHHHATLCIATYGFLIIERTRFSPSARAGRLELCTARIPPHFQPRGSSRARRTA